ncbi:MAG TPA: DUF2490 domain-containing protein [Bacteroidia bacterium]|nr:DUF2490 domain-containing protein [Bacteroidia bacterium]
MILINDSVAQNVSPVIVKDNMLWLGYYNSIIINSKWSVNSDLQFRTKNEVKDYSQALVRADVSYKLKDRLTISVGFAHFRYFLTKEKTRGEWRPWQELKLIDKVGNCRVNHRFRIEQRFNETVKNSEATNDYQFNFRFRYRLDLRYPLLKEKESGNNLYALVGNEIMINAGNNIIYNYFDQDRLYVGINYEINKKIALQLQYMHVWQQVSNGLTLNSTEVLRFNIYHTISL